ncbi:MAG: response regulator [Oscillospiraceae bacterium]|nr:response regulator [Oscillospiraceae bacterium]
MKHILIVDDDKENLVIAKNELCSKYQVTPVLSGAQTLKFLEKKQPDLILLDLNMPEMDGRETLRLIKENPQWAKIPVIFLTANSDAETEAECLALGADDFIAKPFTPKVMHRRISRILELYELRYDLEGQLEARTRQVGMITLNAIMTVANALDAKDPYTRGHCARVAKCSEEIARRLGWSDSEIINLHYVALLHDIGKIGVPDSVLNKPAHLDDEEFAIIKSHTTKGGEILKDIASIKNVRDGALYHHERYDGKGYPFGLKGEDIPINARIICIADCYDAMSTDRCYRPKLPTEKIISEFERCGGSQFDPQIAALFAEMLKEGFSVSYDYTEGSDAGLTNAAGVLV